MREAFAGGQQFGAGRQFETFVMPVIDVQRGFEHDLTGGGGLYREIADFRQSGRMRLDRCSQCPRQQLRAETNAQKRAAGRQRGGNPVQLRPDAWQLIVVVGAHRSTEHHRSSVAVHADR